MPRPSHCGPVREKVRDPRQSRHVFCVNMRTLAFAQVNEARAQPCCRKSLALLRHGTGPSFKALFLRYTCPMHQQIAVLKLTSTPQAGQRSALQHMRVYSGPCQMRCGCVFAAYVYVVSAVPTSQYAILRLKYGMVGAGVCVGVRGCGEKERESERERGQVGDGGRNPLRDTTQLEPTTPTPGRGGQRQQQQEHGDSPAAKRSRDLNSPSLYIVCASSFLQCSNNRGPHRHPSNCCPRQRPGNKRGVTTQRGVRHQR